VCLWDSSEVQRVLLHTDPETGLTALPLAIIHGHTDLAAQILDLDDRTSTAAGRSSSLVSRVYSNGLTAACFAAGWGEPLLLKRILGGGGCDLGVVCAAVGRGRYLDDDFSNKNAELKSATLAHDEVLRLVLSAVEVSRIDLNGLWNGRQPLWFACRTCNHAAAAALMAASATVKPALTTELKFKLDLHRHHTPLAAAAAGGDVRMISWLLT
jgi:hypothetical protein